jgi:hypothetical protein
MALTPVPTPTAAQKVTLSEIVMLSVDEVVTMITSETTQAIADAKWARTLVDIATWADLADEANDIKRVGSIEFFENNIGVSRLAFRNKVLQRYGYPLLTSETGTGAFAVSSGTWF